jgi:hypothetical protein
MTPFEPPLKNPHPDQRSKADLVMNLFQAGLSTTGRRMSTRPDAACVRLYILC